MQAKIEILFFDPWTQRAAWGREREEEGIGAAVASVLVRFRKPLRGLGEFEKSIFSNNYTKESHKQYQGKLVTMTSIAPDLTFVSRALVCPVVEVTVITGN